MKSKAAVILTLSLFSASLTAGPLKDDFYKLQDEIEKAKHTEDHQKEQLEQTLLLSLQRSLSRYYHYKDADKITVSDFQYEEAETDKNTFYIQFKDFNGYFSYENNPRFYTSYPWDEKLLLKPGGTYEKDNSSLINPEEEEKKEDSANQ